MRGVRRGRGGAPRAARHQAPAARAGAAPQALPGRASGRAGLMLCARCWAWGRGSSVGQRGALLRARHEQKKRSAYSSVLRSTGASRVLAYSPNKHALTPPTKHCHSMPLHLPSKHRATHPPAATQVCTPRPHLVNKWIHTALLPDLCLPGAGHLLRGRQALLPEAAQRSGDPPGTAVPYHTLSVRYCDSLLLLLLDHTFRRPPRCATHAVLTMRLAARG